MLSMTIPYPAELVDASGTLPKIVVDNLRRRYRIPAWSVAGAVYGEPGLAKATKAVIRSRFKKLAKRIRFFNAKKVRTLETIARWLPNKIQSRITPRLATLNAALKALEGYPVELPLRLAYWRSGTVPCDSRPMDPARDGCGLIWYSPLVPMAPRQVRDYVDMVRSICPRYGIEPILTLTTVAEGCFDSTVPLLFNPNEAGATRRASDCYKELFNSGAEIGVFPYRVGIRNMELLTKESAPFWLIVGKIKAALDPVGILSPGRYSPPVSAVPRSPKA
jgi:hypothetical protein